MKKICTKIVFAILIALIAVSTASLFMPVKASSDIMPYSYFQNGFSFKGTTNFVRSYEGRFLDIKVKATASNNNNETITLTVYIDETRNTKSYTFYSDGQYHTYRTIGIGLAGGSSVRFTLTGANPAITINTTMETSSYY